MTAVTDAPYCGFRAGKYAEAGPHVIVSGPTGVGKTFRVLGPAAGLWPGPAIVVSSKTDIAELTIPARRKRGAQRVLDLGGHAHLPRDVQRVRYDPTTALETADDALDLAALLLKVGASAQAVAVLTRSGRHSRPRLWRACCGRATARVASPGSPMS
ncbi:type IV secretory system conjugative DNA transfer family protein [Gordonia sp. YC-JH1]|uniref:type IV secretory system conjugative DNA transfer family protein n=1 Tax=Gordonia sp. YC-JH1 TaxID=2059875 RepID=UPI000C7CD7C0|nr:type IV secretory system conjugative DNA transfer family protein [Gordonia sp. YC-JH1]AUH68628.1 hypothetical protein CXX93_10000 [Gordonia sp. YC-JH1]